MYDSDKSSLSSSDSSDSDDQQLTKQEKQTRKNDKRLKNAIAYRFNERKEEQKFRHIFQAWKDFCLLNYRSNLVIAMKHYQNSLCMKGFDGIMEYAMASTSFKQKIVMFYYRFYMNRFMRTLKSGYKAEANSESHQDGKSLEKIISQTNKNLDSLFEKNSKQSRPTSIIQKISQQKERQKQINKDQQGRKQRQIPFNKVKVNQSMFMNLGDIIQQQKIKKIELAFKSIKSYLPNLKKKLRKSPPKNQQPNNIQEEQGSRQTYFLNESGSNQFRRYNQTNRVSDNQQFNSMINSRRSALTQPNFYSGVKQNKSKRKLAPIVEQVQLPAFVKKPSTQVLSKQKKQTYKSPIKPILEIQNPKLQNKGIEKNQQINQQPQIIVKSKPLKNQQQQRQKAHTQNTKRIQEKKDKIREILTKGKLLELCLINDLQAQEQSFFRNYRQLSIETLTQIKSK